MANIFFRFKQFNIFQDQCAMKVGTDGVLLGSWSDVDRCNRVLDIGTGTGLIALMLAQRNTNAQIEAIDIEEQCVNQAQQNIAASRFADRIVAQKKSFLELVNQVKEGYDLIVSNPPFFRNSLKSPTSERNLARHDSSLSYKDILAESALLLNKRGRLAMILPYDCKRNVIEEVKREGQLFVSRITNVYPLPHKPAKRFLIEFVKEKKVLVENDLIVELARHQYSNEYKLLTESFYLDRY